MAALRQRRQDDSTTATKYNVSMGWGAALFLVLGLLSVEPCAGGDPREYLERAAAAYRGLRSFQIEAVTSRIEESGGRHSHVNIRTAVYASFPDKIRIETKTPNNTTHSVLISNGPDVLEYHPLKNEYAWLPATRLNINFDPKRGMGLGEMMYDTIADGATSVRVSRAETAGSSGGAAEETRRHKVFQKRVFLEQNAASMR